MVWAGQDGANTANFQIKYSSRNAGDAVWSGWTNVQEISEARQWDPSLAINDYDDLYVVWSGSDTSSSVKNIKFSEKWEY